MHIPEDEVWLDLLDLTQEVPRWDTLDTQERQRAERFAHAVDRWRFAARRTALRRRLGGLLECPPQAICYELGPSGRPSLASSHHGATLQFSASSAGPMALFGFAHRKDLGVDIEAVRPFPELAQVSEQMLSPFEQLALARTPPEHHTALFFSFWTGLEARLKANGLGLTGVGREVISSNQGLCQQYWEAHHLFTGEKFRFALAVSGPEPHIRCTVSTTLQVEQLFDLALLREG